MISIAMATFNGAQYLSEQLDSILSQTFSDFELVICDDVSTDDTITILQSYAAKDRRIKLFRNDYNLGFKKNFEMAISLCSGEYIAFCDQDDIWFPEHLEVLKKNIGENDLISADSILFYGDEKSKFAKNSIKLSDTNGFFRFPENQKELLYRFLANTMCTPGHNMLIRREFLIKYLPIPDVVKYHDAWIATVAVIKGKYAYCSQPLTYYRQHEKQVTQHSLYSYSGAVKNCLKAIFKKKKYITDRIDFITALRTLGIDEETEKLFTEIENFQKWRMHKTSGNDSRQAYNFFKKNYKLIQTRNDNKYRAIRFLELCVLRFASR